MFLSMLLSYYNTFGSEKSYKKSCEVGQMKNANQK